MSEELIQFPAVEEIRELLTTAKEDISTAVKEDPEMEIHGKLITDVIAVIEEKLNTEKDMTKMNNKNRIFLAAHINFLQTLLEDLFADDIDDLDDFDMDDEEFSEDEDEEEEEDTTEKKK